MSVHESDRHLESTSASDKKRQTVSEMLPSGFKDDKDYVDYMEYRVRYYPYFLGAGILGVVILSTLSYFSS